MKKRLVILLGVVSVLAALTFSAAAQDGPNTYGVVLEGRAVLPADTFAEGPATGAAVSETFGRVGPFESHPVQGVSAVLPADNGNWLVLSDNGFGAKGNSADYLLRWYEVAVDFATGTVEVVGFTQLSDPDGLVPFPIVFNDTPERLLTGADFDIESFRRVEDGTFWIGEEFGPFLLHVDATGKLLEAPIPTPYPDVMAPYSKGLAFIQSPDNPDFVGLADQDARIAAANHRGSRGFEGMALNTSGTMLYGLLEGAMALDPLGSRLMILEFDLATTSYTGNTYFYPMSSPNNAIGEMTAINDNEFIVIERDGGEGEAAAFKRLYKVDLTQAAPDGVLSKTLIADLMAIGDPNGLTTAEEGAIGLGEIFTFPFVTIESVWPVDADMLLVINDNNYPFSAGRRPGAQPDDTEFILITLPEALNLAN